MDNDETQETGDSTEELDETETDDQDQTDEQDTDSEEEAEFDGPFDAKRARRTIDKLRADLKAAKQKPAPKDDAETAKVRSENLRLRVALKAGIDEDLADRLRGSTEEELLEDAQKLLDRFYPQDKKPETRLPKPRLKGGTEPNKEPELSADQLVEKALGR